MALVSEIVGAEDHAQLAPCLAIFGILPHLVLRRRDRCRDFGINLGEIRRGRLCRWFSLPPPCAQSHAQGDYDCHERQPAPTIHGFCPLPRSTSSTRSTAPHANTSCEPSGQSTWISLT